MTKPKRNNEKKEAAVKTFADMVKNKAKHKLANDVANVITLRKNRNGGVVNMLLSFFLGKPK